MLIFFFSPQALWLNWTSKVILSSGRGVQRNWANEEFSWELTVWTLSLNCGQVNVPRANSASAAAHKQHKNNICNLQTQMTNKMFGQTIKTKVLSEKKKMCSYRQE